MVTRYTPERLGSRTGCRCINCMNSADAPRATGDTYDGGVSDEPTADDPALGLRERKKRQSRTAMHRAALELVREHGLSGVTVEAIAQRAGVSTRTFFNHWTTKESAIIGVLSAGGEELGERLRQRIGELGPRQALRAVMREAVAAAPFDSELRELRKEVMAAEPKLHSLSTGNLLSVQTELIQVLAESIDGEDAQERATLAVQLGFAVTRTAFASSMAHGTDLTVAFDEVLARYDSGNALF